MSARRRGRAFRRALGHTTDVVLFVLLAPLALPFWLTWALLTSPRLARG